MAKRDPMPRNLVNLVEQNPFMEDGQPIPGVCCLCGCDDEHACAEGCEWVNVERTLCSACLTMLGRIPLRMLKNYAAVLLPISKLGAAMPISQAKKKGGGRHG